MAMIAEAMIVVATIVVATIAVDSKITDVTRKLTCLLLRHLQLTTALAETIPTRLSQKMSQQM